MQNVRTYEAMHRVVTLNVRNSVPERATATADRVTQRAGAAVVRAEIGQECRDGQRENETKTTTRRRTDRRTDGRTAMQRNEINNV